VFPTKETIRIDTGLPGRPLAVEQSGARPRHFAVLGAQLLGPFRPLDARSGLVDGSSNAFDAPVAVERDSALTRSSAFTPHQEATTKRGAP
jgi:hypothetical protein